MGRARIPGLILLALAPAASADVDLSGFVQQNSAVVTAGANPDGRRYKWLEERVRLQLDAGTDNGRLLVKGDAAYDHLGRGTRGELREGYFDHAGGDWDVRIGRQVVTWGLGDLVFVNDVWPKDHEALFAGRPLEYLKRGVDALKLGAYPEFASFEWVIAPRFTESRIPDAQRFHLPDPMPGAAGRETARPGRGDWGLRIYRDVAGWDAAIYLYRGYRREPSMRVEDPSRPTFFYPELSSYGASLSGRVGNGVLGLEAAYYDSREDRTGIDFTVPNSQARTLVTWQVQPWEDFTLNVQYYAEWMRDYSAYRAALPPGFPVEEKTAHSVAFRATQHLLHQTLRLSVYASRSDTDDYFVSPEVRYNFTDQLWGALGANVFGGGPSGTFGRLSRDDNVFVQIRYEF